MNLIIRITLLTVLAVAIIAPAALFYGMKISPISWHLLDPVNQDSGLVLKGYDAVAYFNDGRAIKGDPNKGLKWNDTIWYFSSDANKLMFKTFPEKFNAQYGGYCADAVSSGFTADVDPRIWHIEDSKLFLFYDDSSKTSFVTSINNGIIKKADSEWSNQ